MLKIALSSVVAAAVLTVAAPLAFAQSELDNSKAYTNVVAAEPSGNNIVILRVDNKTKSAAVLSTTTDKPPANASEAQQLAITNQNKFIAVADNQMASQPYNELDKTSGKPSWYFVGGWGGYNYPVYGYGCGYYCYPANYYYYTPAYYYATPAYSYYYYNTAPWGWNTGYYGGWYGGYRGGYYGGGYGYRGGYGGGGWGGRGGRR